MPEFFETRIDKFIFRIASDRYYTAEGLWVVVEGQTARVGVSDYFQQRSGDVAFAEVKPVGTIVARGDEMATLETIKVNTTLSAPVSGKVVQVNPVLTDAPEKINTDPYGEGWLAVIHPADWGADRARLLPAEQYFEQMKQQAEEDVKKS